MFNDPTSARIMHNSRIIEAKQARTPFKREPTDPGRPSLRQRVLSLVSSLRRRGEASTVLLSGSHELFAGHDQEQLTRLGRFFRVVDVPAGTMMGRQGDVALEFVTLLEGEVGVTIDGAPHAVLDDGSHFGALPLLDDDPGAVHRASFTVMSPTRVAVTDAVGFRSMLAEFPLVAQRVRAMTDVRRAYLAGLAHGNAAEELVPLASVIDEYPVHALQQYRAV